MRHRCGRGGGNPFWQIKNAAKKGQAEAMAGKAGTSPLHFRLARCTGWVLFSVGRRRGGHRVPSQRWTSRTVGGVELRCRAGAVSAVRVPTAAGMDCDQSQASCKEGPTEGGRVCLRSGVVSGGVSDGRASVSPAHWRRPLPKYYPALPGFQSDPNFVYKKNCLKKQQQNSKFLDLPSCATSLAPC